MTETQDVFFPELQPVRQVKVRTVRVPGAPRQPRAPKSTNPCDGCPEQGNPCKVPPTIPSSPLLVALGMAPGAEEEPAGRPFVGPSGAMLRAALTAAGVDAEAQVGYANLARCRPPNDNFDTPERDKAEKHCEEFLEQDLLRAPNAPLLLLGNRPLHAVMGKKKFKIGAYRGLWVRGWERDCFAARHPAQILRIQDDKVRQVLYDEFFADIRRMADRLLGREAPSPVEVEIFDSPVDAKDFLEWLAASPDPWAFDIEAYDGAAYPSRKEVSTDPTHPDFRLRGIAVAVEPEKGYWIECKGWEDRKADVSALLSPAFESDAEKWAFSGHYDEECLVYPGWVRRINRRSGDGLLALLALGNGKHDSLRLEKAVVDVLGNVQYWDGQDKGLMRDIPLEMCARNAVGDACNTYQLCALLHKRLESAEYF